MKRVQYLHYGGPEELRLDEVKPLARARGRARNKAPRASFWPPRSGGGQRNDRPARATQARRLIDASRRVRLPCAPAARRGNAVIVHAAAMARSDVAPAACISRIAGA